MEIKFFYSHVPRLLFIGVLVWALSFPTDAGAQTSRGVESLAPGTMITVRTTEEIDTSKSDGEVFPGVVDKDVMGRNRQVVIPRGSAAELIVRELEDHDLVLDLDAVTIRGRRYGITNVTSDVTAERREGIGANKRTGKYVGGGAALGAIIGAIAGGGKGAAIGAGVGAAGGAGVQVLTRGRDIEVPSEALITFRLEQPLQNIGTDDYYYRDGRRYRDISGDDTSSAAYRAGRAGRSDADRDLPRNPRSRRWSNAADRQNYEAGYNRGYGYEVNDEDTYYRSGTATLDIDNDNNVRWQGPTNGRVYVLVDNDPRRLFAAGRSGTQAAPWIEPGHVYIFVLQDMNGNELARDRLDLRTRYRNRY